MKLIIIVHLILITIGGFFQNIEENKKKEDPRILKIRKWYQEIQENIKNKAYDIINNQNVCYLTKDTKKLVLVSVGVYNDYHEIEEEYYIRNDKLFFYYSKEISMEKISKKPGGITEQDTFGPNEIEYKILEKRIYFDNDEVIRYLTKEATFGQGINTEKEMRKVKNKYENVNKIAPEHYITRVNRWIKEIK